MNHPILTTGLTLFCLVLVACSARDEQSVTTAPPADAAPVPGAPDLSTDAAASEVPDAAHTAAAQSPDPVGSLPDAGVPDAAVPDASRVDLSSLIASLPGDTFDPNVKRIPGVGGVRHRGKLGVNSPGVGGSGSNAPLGALPSTGSMAQVRYGAFSVNGCDASRVRPTMERFLGGFQYCYDQQLTSNPGLSGNLTLRIQIPPDGPVGSAIITGSTLSNSEVESCVARIARRLVFPAANSACFLSVPLTFTAR